MNKDNNVIKILNFISNDNSKSLLINKVNDDIAEFYLAVIRNFAEASEIKILINPDITKSNSIDLFQAKNIKIYYVSSIKSIDQYINSSDKFILFTDYRIFKKFSTQFETINGYNYEKDIRIYLNNYLNIDNENILSYCISKPSVIFSESSKYLVNKENYTKELEIEEKMNFILETRKKIFNLKKNNMPLKKIYYEVKEEVKYKKFNFLTS